VQQWQYLSAEIVWDEATGKWEDDDREATHADLGALLGPYGAEGWELVSLLPERWVSLSDEFNQPPGAGPWEAEVYRALFKRPAETA
jgi:hypothetical protein